MTRSIAARRLRRPLAAALLGDDPRGRDPARARARRHRVARGPAERRRSGAGPREHRPRRGGGRLRIDQRPGDRPARPRPADGRGLDARGTSRPPPTRSGWPTPTTGSTSRPAAGSTVGFTPRSTDTWSVGGQAPVALPAGRTTGKAMAASRQGPAGGSGWRPPERGGKPPERRARTPVLHARRFSFGLAREPRRPRSSSRQPVAPTPPSRRTRRAASAARSSASSRTGSSRARRPASTTTSSPPSPTSRWAPTPTGNLKKRNSDGTLTTGWAGWTSSLDDERDQRRTRARHARRPDGQRVRLDDAAARRPRRRSSAAPTARPNLARQARGRRPGPRRRRRQPRLRAARVGAGGELRRLPADPPHRSSTPSAAATRSRTTRPAPSGTTRSRRRSARAPRTRSSSWATTTGPPARPPRARSTRCPGPTYDLADTIRAVHGADQPVARDPGPARGTGAPGRRRPSSPRATNQSGAQVRLQHRRQLRDHPGARAAKYGRRWDPVEQSPYIVYRRQNCTSTYGCVTSWRQVWYDDAASLARRYQLVNDYGLRGAGMWALGYDGGYQDLYRALCRTRSSWTSRRRRPASPRCSRRSARRGLRGDVVGAATSAPCARTTSRSPSTAARGRRG